MKKQFLNALFFGTLVFSTGTFTACSDDNDDLENRVTVMEGMITEIKTQLSNALTTGASITDWKNENGVWTLTLSKGDPIVINTNNGGGSTPGGGTPGGSTPGGSTSGTNVTVEQGDGFFTITVDGTAYTIPIGAAINSLIYVPEYAGGMVNMGDDATNNPAIDVKFLATPVVSAETLAKAEVTIADAYALKTRADAASSELFKVKRVKLDDTGKYIVVSIRPIQATGAASNGTDYSVAVKLKVSGTTISSNYFTAHIAADFTFNDDRAVQPEFATAVTSTDVTPAGTSSKVYRAPLPDGDGDVVNFMGSFNFKNFFSVPTTQAADAPEVIYELAPKDQQNAAVQGKYDFLKSCLAPDGQWTMKGRPGTNCYDAANDGLLVYIRVDDVIKAKVYWTINDPYKGLDLQTLAGFKGLGNGHMEYGEPKLNEDGELAKSSEGEGIVFQKGVNSLNLSEMIMDNKLSLVHNDNGINILKAFKTVSVPDAKGNILISNNGSELALSDEAKKYCSQSAGIRWYNAQTSLASSQRRGNEGEFDADGKLIEALAPLTNKERGNGEIIRDGLTAEEFTTYGIQITNDGFIKTTAAYEGWALRVGFKIEFQYDYGSLQITDGCFAFLWINRRKAPMGVVDPASR